MKNLKTIDEIALSGSGMSYASAKVLFRDQYEAYYKTLSSSELKAEKIAVKNMPKGNDRRIRLDILQETIPEQESLEKQPELKLWSSPNCQYHAI